MQISSLLNKLVPHIQCSHHCVEQMCLTEKKENLLEERRKFERNGSLKN